MLVEIFVLKASIKVVVVLVDDVAAVVILIDDIIGDEFVVNVVISDLVEFRYELDVSKAFFEKIPRK